MIARETLNITLSEEELILLMARLNIPRMLGVDAQSLDALAEDARTLVLQAAERGLAARGVLLPLTTGQSVLTPEVAAILAVCSAPEWTMIATKNEPEATRSAFFNRRETMWIAQTSLLPRVHQFSQLPGEEAVQIAVQAIVAAQESAGYESIEVTIPQETMDAARNARENGREAVWEALAGSTLPDEVRDVFSEAVASLEAVTTLVGLAHAGGEASRAEGFSVLCSPASTWLLIPGEENGQNGTVRISAVSLATLQDRIAGLMA